MEDRLLPLLRSRVYKALSVCFIYPDEKRFAHLTEGLVAELRESFEGMPHGAALQKDVESLEKALAEVSNGTLQDLRVAYTGLFIYSRPQTPCPPYESVYTEKERRLMGDSTMDVKRNYRAYKLAVSDEFKDLPDHIGAELEFMHFLSYSEGEAASSGRKEECDSYRAGERAFLMEHIGKWVPRFAACLAENSRSAFYACLSRLTNDFVTEDARHLGEP